MSPFRLGFRVCDHRYPFLWHTAGQQAGRWNRAGDQPVHYLAADLHGVGAGPSAALQGSDRALPCFRSDALPIP